MFAPELLLINSLPVGVKEIKVLSTKYNGHAGTWNSS